MTSLKLSQQLSDKIQQIAQLRQMTPEELLESLLADDPITPTLPATEYFSPIVEHLPVVFFISAPNRKHIYYVSPAYEKIMGHPIEKAYKGVRPFLEIVYPDDRSLVEATFKQQAQGHETSMEYRVIHADDSVHWVRSTAFPIQDMNGETVRLVGIAQEITGQKQTLEALYMNEVKLKTLFEMLPVGVSLLNRDQQIVEMNPMLEQIVGLSLAELQADKHKGRRYIASDGSPIAEDELPSARAIVEQRPIFDVEIGFMKDAEDITWTSVSAAPLPFPDYGAVVVTHDITRRRQAEQQAFNLLLEHERVNILTNFIQDASHEFRTPLAIMQSSLYLMSKKDNAEYRAAKLEQIDAQIARMTRLIDMLTTLSRLDSGLDFSLAPTNICYIVREIVMERQSDFAQKQLTLQLDLAEVPPIKIDAKHFAEAIQQILDNALHFTPENGAITVATSHTSGSIIVEISDTGEGIAEKDLPHVLERFYRADTAHTNSGFGLGLAIAHKVVNEHHGTITVSSRAGSGCIVKITLPI